MPRIGAVEEGQFGVAGVLLMLGITITSLYLVYTINTEIVSIAWSGFITYMQPDYLYPTPTPEPSNNNGKNVLLGAVYLNQQVVIRNIVNPLFLFILLLAGMMYIYSDVFESMGAKLKALIPRIVFALILAYASIYIFQALMLIGKAGYSVFYNQAAMGLWKREDYLFRITPVIRLPSSNIPGSSQIASMYWQYIWVFIILVESVSLLIFLAFRMILLGVLLVLLPIASVLLVHPWTQKIGTRIWWLTISLIFVPIAMIIPLMLSTLIQGSVSFVIAALAAVLGSIYLITAEPSLLSGLGFQKAGTMLSGGVAGGAMSGNILAAAGKGENLSGGIKDKLELMGHAKDALELVDRLKGRKNAPTMATVVHVSKSGENLTVTVGNITQWVSEKGGMRR